MAALTSAETTLWTVAVAVGAVVLLVVIAVMLFLLLQLRDIEVEARALGRSADDLRRHAADLDATREPDVRAENSG